MGYRDDPCMGHPRELCMGDFSPIIQRGIPRLRALSRRVSLPALQSQVLDLGGWYDVTVDEG